MGHSSLSFRGKSLTGGDYTVEGWLYFMACEIAELGEPPVWLLDAQDFWNFEARIGINIGTVEANLDKYVTDDDRLQTMLQLTENTIQRLKSFGETIEPEQIKHLGNLRFVPDAQFQLIDPISHFGDAEPIKLWQAGILFLELLQGTLSPTKERLFSFYRPVPIVDYLATLIPDGEIGSAGNRVKLDQQGNRQIWLNPDVYWVSAQNSKAHLTHHEQSLGICEGMPDLAIDVYPVPWLKEKMTFDLHEQYGLQEHWYIDDEEHTVTVRRLVGGKLVVVETLHAGEQFTSNILGGKMVDVNLLLRM